MRPVYALVICGLASLALGCTSSSQDNKETARPDDSVENQPKFPTEDDLARLESVEGKSAAEVVSILGEPERIETRGTQRRWIYPWLASCYVTLEDGIVVNTFYSSGY